jgi:hypothetical protein
MDRREELSSARVSHTCDEVDQNEFANHDELYLKAIIVNKTLQA